MKKVLKANIYFLSILIIEILGPYALRPIYIALGVSDIRLILLFNHLILFLIPAIIYLLVSKSSIKETLKLNKLHWQDILLIILLAFMVQPVMTFLSLISTFFFNNEVGSFIYEIISTPYILLLGLVALLPSITEEITVRGIVLSGYENKNKYVAAAITGLFFGIFHLDGQQFLYATVLGFIFALVVRITNSIYSSMIMHFIINGTSVTLAKISKIITESLPISVETTEFSLNNIGSKEKLLLLITYGVIAIIFSVFVFLIIYALEKLKAKRKVIEGSTVITVEDSKENILNIPFILIVIIYIIFMTLNIYGLGV
ncbi:MULTISPECIES: CPBP family intramembrane glutamic endopeptidase [unclassified Clostridium]|jgi:CAAX amino terminal protease|nr:type II CAAX endopeptidase family protein [Clostridium sp.]MCI6693618.1 CPBP family intramembrane metalloprotease [Clostridium sp.]MDY2632293.1 type II CAAX endopeptidase family protein [Clostridium sp.]MDY4253317.1 type II CAAX endopeptidase family protein [Clostridium sp.]MDY6226353.1 type II CAAX endopeptidase family protein [Clostridium sp.]